MPFFRGFRGLRRFRGFHAFHAAVPADQAGSPPDQAGSPPDQAGSPPLPRRRPGSHGITAAKADPAAADPATLRRVLDRLRD
jgi:hypothetical protein